MSADGGTGQAVAPVRRARQSRARECRDYRSRGAEPARRGPRSVDRGEEAAGGAVEGEAAVLPGCALAQSSQTLHVSPDGTRIRLVLLRERICLGGLLLRQFKSLCDRAEYRLSRRTDLLGASPQENRAIAGGIGIESCTDGVERCRPCVLYRCPHVPAAEASYVLKAPDDVIATNGPKQKHIQGEGGGSDIAVPEDEPAEQTSMRAVGGIVEIAVAVHEEQEHVSVPQIGAARNPFSAEFAVPVPEREVPGWMVTHEVQHPTGQLVVMDSCIAR